MSLTKAQAEDLKKRYAEAQCVALALVGYATDIEIQGSTIVYEREGHTYHLVVFTHDE